jgi:hypothetical protein
MNSAEDIIKEFNENVDAELQLCISDETPYLCAQLEDPRNYEKIRKLVISKVMHEHITIAEAITAIEAELDPNSLD